MTDPWVGSGAALVGRDDERHRLQAFLTAISESAGRIRPPALALVGEPGIGKTTLWSDAVRRARRAGMHVLTSRPSSDDRTVPMQLVVDLCDDDVSLAELAGRLRADRIDDVYEWGAALLVALRDLAVSAPVLIAIDDCQWSDRASARAIRHVLRRCADVPVGLLATHPSDVDSTAELGDPSAQLLTEDAEVMSIGGLSLDAVRSMIADRFGRIPRPLAERIRRMSGGNPMLACELVRQLDDTRRTDSTIDPGAVSVRSALARPLQSLSAPALLAVQLVAVGGPLPVDLIRRASAELTDDGRSVRDDAVKDALDAGVVVIDPQMVVRARHSLLASAAMSTINPLDRCALHAALSRHVTDPDRRIHHVAAATTEPDGAIAAELEAAAERVARRGASDTAAELMRHAIRLSPPDEHDDLVRRRVADATFTAASGDPVRAIRAVDAVLDDLAPGPRWIEAVTLRVFLDFDDSDRVLARALASVEGDDVLAGRVRDLQTWIGGTYRGQVDSARGEALDVLETARSVGDDDLVLLSATVVSTTSLTAGERRDDLLDEAIDIARRQGGPRLGRRPEVFRGRHLMWDGHLDEARDVFREMFALFRESGTEFQRPYRLHDLARVELARGRLDDAATHVDDAVEAAHDAGNSQAMSWLTHPQGLVAAYRGDDTVAARCADFLDAWAIERREPPRAVMADHVRGVLALGRGDAAAACDALGRAVDGLRAMGVAHPGVLPVEPLLVDAASSLGDVDTARTTAARLVENAGRLGAPWPSASAHAAEGMVALARGDTDGAIDSLTSAHEGLRRCGDRLGAARTELALARAHVRAGRRLAAADWARRADETFVAEGCRDFSEQVRRLADRMTPGGEELTPTESEVARLVAAGRRNREIASELFVSVSTVESHLTRMYRKLGLRNRAELAALVLDSTPV